MLLVVLLVADDVLAVGNTAVSMSKSSSQRHTISSPPSSTPSKTKNLRGNYVLDLSIEQATNKNGWRSLSGPPALVTPRCNVIRMEAYQAELQLVYSYFVEFASGKTRNLVGIEQAITYAVAQELDACDEFDRPRYKIKTNTKHVFSKERKFLHVGWDAMVAGRSLVIVPFDTGAGIVFVLVVVVVVVVDVIVGVMVT